MESPSTPKIEASKMTTLEIQSHSSLEYFRHLVKHNKTDELAVWLRNTTLRYKGDAFGPITKVILETEFGTNNAITILIRKGGNTLSIPFSDIDTGHKNLFGPLPKAPEQWVRTNPESSFHTPVSAEQKNEPIKEAQQGFFARIGAILGGFGFMKPKKQPELPQDVTAPISIALPIDTTILETVSEIKTPAEPLTENDLPIAQIEEAIEPEPTPEKIPPVITEPLQTQEGSAIVNDTIHEIKTSTSDRVRAGLKLSIAAGIMLSTAPHSTAPQKSKNPTLPVVHQIQPREVDPEPTMEKLLAREILMADFEHTIKKHDTIYGFCKKNNLPDETWKNYKKYWRLQLENGSYAIPEATNLPIGGKLVYFANNAPEVNHSATTITKGFTIWQYCKDNNLADEYWQHPHNHFLVQFPEGKEYHKPNVFDLPVGGTLLFFESPNNLPVIPKEIKPSESHQQKSDIKERSSESVTQKITSTPTERLQNTIGVVKPLPGEVFHSKTGNYIAGEEVLYKEERCKIIGRSYDGGLILELLNHNVQFALKPTSVSEFIARLDDTPINALL